MPRISEINPETAPEAIQKIIADHLADGHALTAEKRTLLHNAAAFNAVEAGSYALDDELQRLIGSSGFARSGAGGLQTGESGKEHRGHRPGQRHEISVYVDVPAEMIKTR